MKAAKDAISDAQRTAVSGQDCPLTGVWQALCAPLPPLLVRRGDIMPAACGRVVTWELLHPESQLDANLTAERPGRAARAGTPDSPDGPGAEPSRSSAGKPEPD